MKDLTKHLNETINYCQKELVEIENRKQKAIQESDCEFHFNRGQIFNAKEMLQQIKQLEPFI